MNENLVLKPKLDVLPASQRQLWDELSAVPPHCVLYGGTAVALHLGHHQSVDFAFFSNEKFDPDALYHSIAFLENSKIIQKSAHTLTCIVKRSEEVQISFFGVPEIRQIHTPYVIMSNKVKVASLLDLAGMKVSVLQKRAEAKDYLDLDAIFENTDLKLPDALSAGKMIYGESFNPLISLKALSYFEDGNLATLPEGVKNRLTKAVERVDINNLPSP